MSNPFEFFAQVQAFKDSSAELLTATEPSWFLRAATAKVLEFLLGAVLDAGPPEGFARAMGVDDQQARVLYSRVLHAAILRQRERVSLHA